MSNFASSIRAHYKSLFNIHFCRTLRHIISQSNRRHYCKRLFYDWRRITTPSKVFHSTEGYCHHFIVVLCKLPVFFSLSLPSKDTRLLLFFLPGQQFSPARYIMYLTREICALHHRRALLPCAIYCSKFPVHDNSRKYLRKKERGEMRFEGLLPTRRHRKDIRLFQKCNGCVRSILNCTQKIQHKNMPLVLEAQAGF